MLNSKAKEEAIKRLKELVNEYEEKSEKVRKKAVQLYDLRLDISRSIITACEKYISDLANAPKEFKKSVSELKIEYQTFFNRIQELESQANKISINSGTTAASGIVTGVGVAAFAPSAAMAVATTFGTASTGAAISTLSGAAATNAALAWLGGGAIAAGGGGMATGNALLALAGPIGWAIGGASLIGAGGYAFYKNTKIIEDANSKSSEVKKQILTLDRAYKETKGLIELTQHHSNGVREQLKLLQSKAPSNYHDFTDSDKKTLGALINNINSLSQVLNTQIEFDT
jgi:hypothetical protein